MVERLARLRQHPLEQLKHMDHVRPKFESGRRALAARPVDVTARVVEQHLAGTDLDQGRRQAGEIAERRRESIDSMSLRARGMSTTAAFVALGRKLARVCFALLKNGTDFNPDRRSGACAAT